ncbi:TetR/AcrR family transcriptional regulator [Phenylobacterium sp. LjRoot225]|uniref:TetR/AcrR family transcriptional regulator n=1 Tax=Phenylobacterium sp. LjRoot225 TaxID=3342285 RepID=UPI003ED0594F
MAAKDSGRRKAVDASPAREATRAASVGQPPGPTAKPSLADRRATILNVATRRFAEFGFEATTVRQLADDVNILSGSLYHHFATKDEMLHEIVRDAVLQVKDNAIRIARAPLDAEHRLVAMILLDLGEMTRNQEVHAILSNERRFFRRREEFAYVVEAKRDAYHAWRAVLQDGMDTRLFKPDLDIYLTISTIVRMLNAAAEWYANEDASMAGAAAAYTLDQVTDFHLDFILNAVRAPARAAEPVPRQACEELAKFRA